MRYALGIDGGGTKCEAALVGETGEVVGWGRGGPIHTYYHPPEVIFASYADAFRGALGEVKADELWVAGIAPEGPPREALEAASAKVHQVKADEIESAYASAQQSWGLVVLAGTGSFVHGRTPEGRDLHWGGMGPVLNDYGSAYEIGLRGLRAAFASRWTESRRTRLAQAIPAAMGLPDLQTVFRRVYAKPMTRDEVAALARVVDKEAEQGDAVAVQCLLAAADELANLACDLIQELGLADAELPVIPVGSVARRCRIWWERVCARIGQVAPRMRAVIPPLLPATGAALIGLRAMGVEWTPEVIARAVESEAKVRAEKGMDGHLS